MAETYEDLLFDVASRDERVVVMTAENRAVIRGLQARLPERFIDVGIAEMTMVGAAAGLALQGRIPVIHALATFLVLRAYEFVRTDVGIAGAPVKLVGYVPGLLSEANGPTHQAIEDVAVMSQIPGMRVFCPSDREELLEAMPAIISDPHPWYVRYHDAPATVPHDTPYAHGQAEWVFDNSRDGVADVALITYGLLTAHTWQAARQLAEGGLVVRCLNMRTLAPLDEKALLEAARSSLVVTVEDHLRTGGLYSRLCEVLIRHGMASRVESFALDSWFHPTLLPGALRSTGLDAASLAEGVRTLLTVTPV